MTAHANRQETIAKEWDEFDLAHPGPLSRFVGDSFGPDKNVSAGRYGTWTNLFLIGQIVGLPFFSLLLLWPFTYEIHPSRWKQSSPSSG